MTLYCKHVALMAPFDRYRPKHHATFHLLFNSAEFGNPNYYSCWRDEADNKVLKSVCRYSSQMVFEQTVVMRMREVLRGTFTES